MRKFLALIIITAMLAASFIGFGTAAFAAGEALDVTTDITEMLEGGPVDFDATITAGDTALIDYTIVCNGTPCYDSDGATLAAYTSVEVSFTMEVTDAMLGNPIEFVLVDDSNPNLATDSLTIEQKVLTIDLKASGSANKTLAPPGDLITFSFAIENQGEADIDDIVVSAPELNGGDPLRDAFALVSTQSFTVIYKCIPIEFSYDT